MTSFSHVWIKRVFGVIAAITLVSAPVCAETNPRDPYEGLNRNMFAVHEVIDDVVAKPLGKAYDMAIPLPVKASVGNFFGNVSDLWTGVNGALQGKPADAGIDFGRLVINSTLGIFGLFDVASELGLDKHEEDFGQTMAVWGVQDGGYLFIPVIGPRTLRDFAGWGVDAYVDPVRHVQPITARNSMAGLRIVNLRASLLPADKVVEEAALDKYAYIRDAYLQRRRNQIFDGYPPRIED